MDKETISLNEKAIKKAIEGIKKTYSPDKMLMQAVQALTEEEHAVNVEFERLKEFYWRYYPESLDKIDDVKKLINLVLKNEKKPNNSMGYDLSNDEIKLINDFAVEVKNHLKILELLDKFITNQARIIAPETSKIAGPVLTARLMALAGGFKEMALLPASTIQLLGAEKALFRHLRTNARPPKHGIILQHQSVQSSKEKGKAARQLANKISIAIKIDYFRGAK